MRTRRATATVAHVVPSMDIGGMETVIANLAGEIDRNRFRLVVLCLKHAGAIGLELREQGLPVRRIHPMVKGLSFLYPGALVSALRKEGARIVHAHTGCWHKAAVAARISGAKGMVYTEHGRRVPDSRNLMRMDRMAARITDRVVPVSISLFEYMNSVVGIPSRKLRLIENGIDTLRFNTISKSLEITRELGLTSEHVVLGSVGRLSPVKDQQTLIRAFHQAHRNRSNLRLILVGDGEERAALERLVAELGLQESVRLLGSRRDVRAILSTFDVFVSASISEGTSMTLLEAMASGKPVVATDVGGNGNVVIPGRTGLLVEPGEPEKLASAVLYIAANQRLRNEMGRNARRVVQDRFDVARMAREYEHLYDELIGDS